MKSESEVPQSCPTPNDPMDYSPLGSSIHGILQARVLEWGAIAFSSSVAQSCPILCDFMDCSTPGFLSFTLSLSSFNLMSIESVMLSNHLIFCHPLLFLLSIFPSNGIFQLVSSSHQVTKVMRLQLQHQSFQCIFRVDFL